MHTTHVVDSKIHTLVAYYGIYTELYLVRSERIHMVLPVCRPAINDGHSTYYNYISAYPGLGILG